MRLFDSQTSQEHEPLCTCSAASAGTCCCMQPHYVHCTAFKTDLKALSVLLCRLCRRLQSRLSPQCPPAVGGGQGLPAQPPPPARLACLRTPWDSCSCRSTLGHPCQARGPSPTTWRWTRRWAGLLCTGVSYAVGGPSGVLVWPSIAEPARGLQCTGCLTLLRRSPQGTGGRRGAGLPALLW